MADVQPAQEQAAEAAAAGKAEAEDAGVPPGAAANGMGNGAADSAGHPVSTALPQTEDAKFFAFVKQYLTLLTGIATVPLLASAINALPPPELWSSANNTSIHLTILSSFLCLVTFAACFMARGPLGRWANSKEHWVESVPFGLTSLLVILAVISTAAYVHSQESTGYYSLPTVLYLITLPLYVAALGVFLVTSFSMQGGYTIQTLVDQHLDEREAALVLRRVRAYTGFVALTHDPANAHLKALAAKLLEPSTRLLTGLEHGRLTVDSHEAPILQRRLLKQFCKRFDGVSNRSLGFWLGREGEHLLADYLKVCSDAVLSGCRLTRLFIFSDDDLGLNDNSDAGIHNITAVLTQQEKMGVAWGVALDGELSADLQAGQILRRFGLHDNGKALSYYRDLQEGRIFNAILRVKSTPPSCNLREIAEQKRVYESILERCWMANTLFVDDFAAPADARNAKWTSTVCPSHSALRERMSHYNAWLRNNLKRPGVNEPAGTANELFLIPVSKEDSIEASVRQLIDYRKQRRAATGAPWRAAETAKTVDGSPTAGTQTSALAQSESPHTAGPTAHNVDRPIGPIPSAPGGAQPVSPPAA